MTKARRLVSTVAVAFLAGGILTVLYGAALDLETRSAAPVLAVVSFPPDRPPPPADPPVTVTTVVTQTSITTVITTVATTVPSTVTTIVTTTVQGPATQTVYVCQNAGLVPYPEQGYCDSESAE